MFRKIVELAKNPEYTMNFLKTNGKFHNISDEKFINLKFKRVMGYDLNISNPQTFNEKLQWLKLYDKKDIYTKLVDKYEVREFISEKIGEQYLVPLYGVYNSYEEINFDKLPEKFVLKPTHTSGNVYICENKNNINHLTLEKKVNEWLEREYFWVHREWPYKNVKPRIIAEKYLEDEEVNDLVDYKLMVFNGKVKCTLVAANRNTDSEMTIDFYDNTWEKLPFGRPNIKMSAKKIKRPANYRKMVQYAELLSKDIPFVRVDFYEVNKQLYFGELTFYPGAGMEKFNPEIYDRKMGDMLDLPIKNN